MPLVWSQEKDAIVYEPLVKDSGIAVQATIRYTVGEKEHVVHRVIRLPRMPEGESNTLDVYDAEIEELAIWESRKAGGRELEFSYERIKPKKRAKKW